MPARAGSPPKRPGSPTTALSPSVAKAAKRDPSRPLALSAQAAPFNPSSSTLASVTAPAASTSAEEPDNETDTGTGSSSNQTREVKNLPGSKSNRNGPANGAGAASMDASSSKTGRLTN